MNLTLEQLQPAFLNPKISEGKLVHNIGLISKLYTSNREELKGWTWTDDLVSAYSAFYLPTNIPKFSFAIEQFSDEIKNAIENCEVVDIGTGPGTYLLAFFREFPEAKGPFYGYDFSTLMIEQARKMVKHFFSEKKCSIGSILPGRKSKKRLLIFGNSLNEMLEEEIIEIIDDMEADYVLFIEPGTSSVFKKMLNVRSKLFQNNWNNVYPCPTSKAICPIKDKLEEGKEDWCHQVIRMIHEPCIERISQMAKLDRKSMPLIAHFYSKNSRNGFADDEGRLVRFIDENKHSFQWEVCMVLNSIEQLVRIEIPKKTLSKSEVKELKNNSVGGIYKFEIIKEISPVHFRAKLIF